jgi:hypothetical protein
MFHRGLDLGLAMLSKVLAWSGDSSMRACDQASIRAITTLKRCCGPMPIGLQVSAMDTLAASWLRLYHVP